MFFEAEGQIKESCRSRILQGYRGFFKAIGTSPRPPPFGQHFRTPTSSQSFRVPESQEAYSLGKIMDLIKNNLVGFGKPPVKTRGKKYDRKYSLDRPVTLDAAGPQAEQTN